MKLPKIVLGLLMLVALFAFTAQQEVKAADWPWTETESAGGLNFSVSPTNIDSIGANVTYTKWNSNIAAYDNQSLTLTHLINLAASGDSLLIILQGRPSNWAGSSSFYWDCDSVLVTGSGDDNVVIANTLSLSSWAGEYRLAFKYLDAANGTTDEVDAVISICPANIDNVNERKSFLAPFKL